MSGLEYRKALPDEAERIFYIVQHTKDVIYPDYYTQAVVEFFGRLHSFDNIKIDIEQGRIYALVKDGKIIGTGSHTENHITRVYVLPEYQGQGFGSLIMDELEKRFFRALMIASLTLHCLPVFFMKTEVIKPLST